MSNSGVMVSILGFTTFHFHQGEIGNCQINTCFLSFNCFLVFNLQAQHNVCSVLCKRVQWWSNFLPQTALTPIAVRS